MRNHNKKQSDASLIVNCQLSIVNSAKRRGMTLVELLVVIAIMVLMVAVSLPTFKPMLESQRTAGGARTVAMALQRARVRAMKERIPYGVQFLRFENADNAALQMRLVRTSTTVSGESFNRNVRVRVSSGAISLYEFRYNSTSENYEWQAASTDINNQWNDLVKEGDLIQLGRQGHYYQLVSSSGTLVVRTLSGDNVTIPENTSGDSCVEFTVMRSGNAATSNFRAALSPMLVMPRGTIVDMSFSGVGSSGTQFGGLPDFTIMFSPGGYVSGVYANGFSLPETNDLIYLCIGEWDRMSSGGTTLAEDGRNNIETASNFWITVHPRTGEVRTAEMNADANVQTARKFATKHFQNIGDF